jgi:hypothetical protein
MKHSYFYRAFGLTLQSELRLPELFPVEEADPDVVVRMGGVPEPDEDWVVYGACFKASERSLLLELETVGRYFVMEGKTVVIDPEPTADEDTLRLFLLGSAFGALLHQRGLVPFHCSAVEWEGKGVGFLGASGAGKSTSAAAMRQWGGRLLSDDLCVISFDAGGLPALVPGISHSKLWADSMHQLQLDTGDASPVRNGLEKYRVPFRPECAGGEPVPLHRLYLLREDPRNTGITLEPLTGPEKVRTLLDHTYRRKMIAATPGRANQFSACARIAHNSPMRRLTRPAGRFHLEEFVGLILKDLHG